MCIRYRNSDLNRFEKTIYQYKNVSYSRKMTLRNDFVNCKSIKQKVNYYSLQASNYLFIIYSDGETVQRCIVYQGRGRV